MRPPMRLILLWSAILILNCLSAPCGIAQTVSPRQLAHQMPEAMPRSDSLDRPGWRQDPCPRGAGLHHSQERWVLAGPVGSEMGLGPSKRVACRSITDPGLFGVPPGYGRLWAVPLKMGMNPEAWPAEQTVTSVQAEDNQNESPMDVTQSAGGEDDQKQYLSFLSPDYLSFYLEQSSSGRISLMERTST